MAGSMHAFDVLGDPVRRRILELLADAGARGALPAGAIAATVGAEFGISQPAVSQHLKVLREAGFTSVAVDGQRRLYALDVEPLRDIDRWLERYRSFWDQRLDALATELVRGRRRQLQDHHDPDDHDDHDDHDHDRLDEEDPS